MSDPYRDALDELPQRSAEVTRKIIATWNDVYMDVREQLARKLHHAQLLLIPNNHVESQQAYIKKLQDAMRALAAINDRPL